MKHLEEGVSMMEDKILELIDKEDKRKPLTDSDIAEIVHTTREYITEFRKKTICQILVSERNKFC